LSQEIGDFALLYGVNSEFLCKLGLNRYRVVTDRQTDRQTVGIAIASAHQALRAVARNDDHSCNKILQALFCFSNVFLFI